MTTLETTHAVSVGFNKKDERIESIAPDIAPVAYPINTFNICRYLFDHPLKIIKS